MFQIKNPDSSVAGIVDLSTAALCPPTDVENTHNGGSLALINMALIVATRNYYAY